MNLFQLECFLAVTTHLNFARAADQMNISQPAISHQVQSLENELHVKLFHRSTRSVTLTVEGQVFLSDAKNIVMMSRTAIHRFATPARQEVLDLSIGCYAFAGLQRYSKVLRRLSAKYENIHPRISTLPDSRLFNQVEDGLLDVALKIKNEQKRKSSLIYRELGKVSLLCLVSPDHPLAALESVSVDRLKEEKLILYEPSHAGVSLNRLQRRIAEGRLPSDLYFCESLEAALLLASSGLGVSILPETFYLFRELNLKRIPLLDVEPLSYGLYYKSGQTTPHLLDFITYMTEFDTAVAK